MLGVFSEFETNLRRERQAEGIARAKGNGERRENGELKYAGRPAKVSRERIRELRAAGVGPSAIARELGIARTTVYEALK